MTTDIGLVLSVLAITIFLFVSEKLRVDVIAILIMVSLPWLGLVKPEEAFTGLASNAVVSIIAVMILGYGIDRAGVMSKITRPILKAAASSERKLIGIIASTVGLISGFMQNIGAVALFLPALLRISKKTRIPASRLLMPVGFAGILGGTLTMIGSGPLIILNDLLRQGGQEAFGLFSVTPLGLSLLAAGVLYFLLLGRWVLPERSADAEPEPQQQLVETWQLPTTLYYGRIPDISPLLEMTLEETGHWNRYHIHLLALRENEDISYAPWRHTRFAAGQLVAVLGPEEQVERFFQDYRLERVQDEREFGELGEATAAGFAEVIVPPRSTLAGKTLRQINLRKHYSVEPVMLLSGDREQRDDFSDMPLQPGDTLIVHGRWELIAALGSDRHFVVVSPVHPASQKRSNPVVAVLALIGAMTLAVSGVQLSVALFSGALAMILFRVVPIDEAYKAVDWRTVFLLAGLIPLGIAMDNTGAAEYIARQVMGVLQHSHPVFILFAVAVLTTLFSLFMSNVAATVLLVPLVMIMAEMAGIDPRALGLLVAVAASNSFVLPTHQVNALLMAPGGYRNADYMKSGGIMTLIFLVILVGFFYLFLI
jgi:di/tricarboxylate transporter